MSKEIFLWNYTLWNYALTGDLLNGVLGLAIEMRENRIEQITDRIFQAQRERGFETSEETELLKFMLDLMLNSADVFYENAEDIRAAFETQQQEAEKYEVGSRYSITGEVVKVGYLTESSTKTLRLKDAEGNVFQGSLPFNMQEMERGDRVTFRATIESDYNDEYIYSRPLKGLILKDRYTVKARALFIEKYGDSIYRNI